MVMTDTNRPQQPTEPQPTQPQDPTGTNPDDRS